MIFGAIFGYFFWRDLPDLPLVCGTVIIVAASLSLVRYERRVSRMVVHADAANQGARRGPVRRSMVASGS